MKILLSQYRGFCAGVKRAVDTALSEPKGTYALGELVHNERVQKELAERGIVTVTTPEGVPDGARLLIRSHGAPPAVFEDCKRRGIEVVDCTCPFVRRTQDIVEKARREGKKVVIAGDASHPEVEGLVGWAGEAFVTQNGENLSRFCGEEVVLVAQTTFLREKFSQIEENLRKVYPKTLEVFPTICYTTGERQRDAARLARESDAVVVIGGGHSRNTERLAEIASREGAYVVRVTDADDFEYETIKNFGRVGVIAGASTPEMQTREVLSKMVENNAEVQETEAPVEATAPVEETPVAVAPEALVEAESPAEVAAPEQPASAMAQVLDDIDKEESYKKGQIIRARIVSATDEEIFVSGSGKLEIRIPKTELDCEVYDRKVYEEKAKAGEEIEVMVTAVRPTVLSEKMVKRLKEEEALLDGIKDGSVFSVVCTDTNKGGLTAQLGTYLVFVPRREIRMGYVQDLEKYKGKTLRLKLIEIRNERRKEIIASQRLVLEAEKAERDAARAAREEAFFSSVNVGDVVEGKVERITSFGAFVSVNGFDCLAHISDLSWSGVKEVTDVLEIGKKYNFKVLKIDRDNKKVSIGYKQLQPQPWDLAAEKYAEGDIVHGKVVRIVPFGAFVELERGIDGLVHVSQISHEWLENPTSALTIGEEVDAQIIKFSPAEHKITLSIKALQPRDFEPREESEPRPAKVRKARPSRGGNAASSEDEEEYREWKEGTGFGASIFELTGGSDDKN